MSAFSGSGLPGSYNDDVLGAEPQEIDEKDRLVAEIKSRAKGCISSRNYPEAVKLYSKAIENAEHDIPGSAILYSNRSMCYLTIGNIDGALADARQAQQLDGTYVKSYYREAMALRAQQQYTGAKNALLKGLQLKPDDKEMKAQLTKVDEDLNKLQQKSSASSFKSGSSTASKSISKASPTTATTASAGSSTDASAPTTSTAHADDNDDDDDIGNLNLRGYKKTSDGRTTTFFNHELDEKSKRLIGDIAPKKIEKNETVTPPPAVSGGGSVWNSAGTYEERILTPWASSRLTELMSSISLSVPANAVGSGPVSGATITVVKVEDVTGDAQVSMIRGKTKYICDFSLNLHWRLELEMSDRDDETVEGKMAVVDITADKDFEIGDVEISQYKGKSCSTSALPQPISQTYSTFIKGSSKGLQLAVKEKLEAFCAEFKLK